MSRSTQVFILLGPNGVGKTTIGRILEKHFGCRFISPEEFFMSRYATVDEYRQHREIAYREFEAHLRAALLEQVIVFEEVGLSDVSRHLIENLKRDFTVCMIKVMADEQTCLRRILARGTTRNYPKSADSVVYIRNAFLKDSHYTFDLEIQNENLTEAEIYQQIRHLFIEPHTKIS